MISIFQERMNRPQSTLAGGLDDISSPDLGVDVGSDPYSSLERPGSLKTSFNCNIKRLT